MRIGKILLCGLLMALPVLAEESDDRQTATSLHYVSHELDTRQNKLSAGSNKALTYTNAAGNVLQRDVKANLTGGTTDTSLPMVNAVNAGLSTKQNDIAPIDDHTAVTYTEDVGTIGAKGIYQDSGTYVEQTDNLIDAKTFNAALKNGLDNEFVCADRPDAHDPNTNLCWLWEIHNTVTNNASQNGYVQIEYIESDGTQYIDTGVVQDTRDFRVDIDAAFSNGNRMIFGVSNNSPMYFGHSSRGFEMQQQYTSLVAPYGERVHMEWGKNPDGYNMKLTVTVNGQSETLLSGMFGSVTNNNFMLFSNNIGSNINSTLRGKIYSCKIYKDGILVFDGIPVKQGDNVGMYDRVSNSLKLSAVQNTNFTAGPPINVYLPQNQQ